MRWRSRTHPLAQPDSLSGRPFRVTPLVGALSVSSVGPRQIQAEPDPFPTWKFLYPPFVGEHVHDPHPATGLGGRFGCAEDRQIRAAVRHRHLDLVVIATQRQHNRRLSMLDRIGYDLVGENCRQLDAFGIDRGQRAAHGLPADPQ
jgi:hypothetical protein